MPPSATLVYDGECGFCRWSLAKLSAALPVRPRFVTAQSADLPGLGLTPDQAGRAAWWIDDTGHHEGHRAFARWLQASGGWWRLAGKALDARTLRPLLARAYRTVARHRTSIPGPWEKTCSVVR